ncbi:MAG: VWA domain-containing protein [Verrucomicrobiota bacterium]
MTDFTFQWPAMLLLLPASGLLVWVLRYAQSNREKTVQAMGGSLSPNRRIRNGLFLTSWILLVLAIARPGYDPIRESFSRSERDVVFALDVSQSMLAEDAQPNRLEVAKQGIRDALTSLNGERVGLIAFAGSATIFCPLTEDYDFVNYMLDQIHPRAVDFGGTALQSAVEKAVDQVFMDNREGLQDLVVITDGGDHSSQMDRITELLDEHGVDSLIVGIGNPNQGATIPIIDDKGLKRLMKNEEGLIYTRLEDSSLSSFASKSNRVTYYPVTTAPFHLGNIYLDQTKDKPRKLFEQDQGTLTYQEANAFFLVPALLFLLVAHRWKLSKVPTTPMVAIAIAVFFSPRTEAASDIFTNEFQLAVELYEAKNYGDAAESFATLEADANQVNANAEDLAVVQFNRGLCLNALAEEAMSANPWEALRIARQSQSAYLSAKRYSPSFERAGRRLDTIAQLVEHIQKAIRDREAAEALIQEELEEILNELESLRDDQEALKTVTEKTQQDATQALGNELAQQQSALKARAQAIGSRLETLDQTLFSKEGVPPEYLINIRQAVSLIGLVVSMQNDSEKSLPQTSEWSLALTAQSEAITRITEIIELFMSDSNAPSDGEGDPMSDEYDYMDDAEQSATSSDMSAGDFAAQSEMQTLPIPNYSAEDILLEEQGSQQFRQQKRAGASAANVEKDY